MKEKTIKSKNVERSLSTKKTKIQLEKEHLDTKIQAAKLQTRKLEIERELLEKEGTLSDDCIYEDFPPNQ